MPIFNLINRLIVGVINRLSQQDLSSLHSLTDECFCCCFANIFSVQMEKKKDWKLKNGFSCMWEWSKACRNALLQEDLVRGREIRSDYKDPPSALTCVNISAELHYSSGRVDILRCLCPKLTFILSYDPPTSPGPTCALCWRRCLFARLHFRAPALMKALYASSLSSWKCGLLCRFSSSHRAAGPWPRSAPTGKEAWPENLHFWTVLFKTTLLFEAKTHQNLKLFHTMWQGDRRQNKTD